VADPVDVFVQIAGKDLLAGQLRSHRRRQAESATFRYASGYLANSDAYELDPSLPLLEGAQQTPQGQALFGAFSDCSPDRWGKRLVDRAERHRVEEQAGTRRSFGAMDYLLGVRDDLRQGALHFRYPDASEFLSPEVTGIPPFVELGKLLGAVERLERDSEDAAELALLLRGASSLGGARPKAHVLDPDGRISIAKFPSPSNDEWDVMLWEAVALRLAEMAGINVSASKLYEIDGKHVLIVERFDRIDSQRIGYVSAMTMLQRADGDAGSYLEIADAIAQNSPHAERDLHELWRRVVFSILISNFDDHLRNHGFLRLNSAGWSLSPAFDLNPDPRAGPRELHTAIDFDQVDASIELALGVADEFRLSEDAAADVVAQVSRATEQWRSVAQRLGAKPSELDQVAPAFEHQAAAEAHIRIARIG
jgi:serine/threonine-protein kinase HipA